MKFILLLSFALFTQLAVHWPVCADIINTPYVRTDIKQIPATEHKDLTAQGLDIDSLRKAHVEAAAALLNIYPNPNQHIYYLARDAEYLYDVAKILAPGQEGRLHLINVSRLHVAPDCGDPHTLKAYLKQEGISEDHLKAGKQVILIDTGWMGSIPEAIQKLIPHEEGQIISHFLVSKNPAIPPLRSAVQHLNSMANRVETLGTSSMIAYESLAREFNRSDRYARIPSETGSWVPICAAVKEGSDTINVGQARKIREDFRFYAENAGKQLYEDHDKIWKALVAATTAGQEDKLSEVIKDFKKTDKDYHEGILRDLIATVKSKRLVTKFGDPETAANKIQKLAALPNLIHPLDNFDQVAKEFPDAIELGPPVKFNFVDLVRKKEWAKLGGIFEVLRDNNAEKALAQSLLEAMDLVSLEIFLKACIDSENSRLHETLIQDFFGDPKSVKLNQAEALLRFTKVLLAQGAATISLQGELMKVLGVKDHLVGPKYNEARLLLINGIEPFGLLVVPKKAQGEIVLHLANAGICGPMAKFTSSGKIR